MCGIAGLLNVTGAPVDATPIGAMCELIGHRGPDDEGLWMSGPVALGHRRLSIIDLSPRGRNPIPNEDETVWIVFNGEIYNYQQLRRELVSRGHRFRSDTDTEVIVHLYEDMGPACVESLNGMFAFAVYDRRAGADGRGATLLLARDRFGVKPLYYVRLGDVLAFASEAKAFLALPQFEVRVDHVALAEHFTFQNTLGERTFFEGVQLLAPGHYLTARDGRVERHQYWDLQFQPDTATSFEDCASALRARFEDAVSRQLRSDVPVGSYLSGGMDTGCIAAIAARQIPGLHTFTCGFDVPQDASELEKLFDERSDSRRLARHLSTCHHELELGPHAMMQALPQVVWHLDEPRVGISYQVYYTAELIGRYVRVVMSGVGGDELFAGYPWRYQPVLQLDRHRFEDAYYRLSTRFLTDPQKREFFTDETVSHLGDFSTFDTFRAVVGGTSDTNSLHRALYFDFKTFLAGLLVVDDKLTMAHSVEARVPFLDNDLVDYVLRIPAAFKLRGSEGKAVLRHAMRGLLPDDVLTRRKQGFTPPDQSWYKKESLGYVTNLILGPRGLARGHFKPAFLRRIIDDHVNNRQNHRFLIWSLMCFEWWNRLFVDRDPLEAAIRQEGGAPTSVSAADA